MGFPSVTFPSELPPVVRKELDAFAGQLQSILTAAGIAANGQITNPSAVNPVGTLLSLAHQFVPDGWLLCDGRPVSRATYPALWQKIGATWGAGNGTTTFNLPDLSEGTGHPTAVRIVVIKT